VNRLRLLLAALVASVLPFALGDAGAQAVSSTPGPYENGVLTAINHARAQHGLSPLRFSSRLEASALEHSWSMASAGYFSHSSRDGTSFGIRISHYYGTRGYTIWRVGETLFWWTPDATPKQVVNAWLRSPEHRAIVLSPLFCKVGIGVVHASSAPGTFLGRPTTLVTADYGLRR
jgi:uncharacterized protein YkwD